MIYYSEEKKELIIPTGLGNLAAITEAQAEQKYESGYTAGKADGLEEGYESAYTQYQRGYNIYMSMSNDPWHGGSIIDEIYINGKLCADSTGHTGGQEITMTAYTCDKRLNTLSFVITEFYDSPSPILCGITSFEISRMYRDIVSQEHTVESAPNSKVRHIYTLTFNNERMGDSWSYGQGFNDGTQTGYEIGYGRGWQDGYNSGRTDGVQSTGQHTLKFRTVDGHAAVLEDNRIVADGKDTGAVMNPLNPIEYATSGGHVLCQYVFTNVGMERNVNMMELWIDYQTDNYVVDEFDTILVDDYYTLSITEQTKELLPSEDRHLYKYTFTFDNAPIYDKASYEAGLAACQNNENQ